MNPRPKTQATWVKGKVVGHGPPPKWAPLQSWFAPVVLGGGAPVAKELGGAQDNRSLTLVELKSCQFL